MLSTGEFCAEKRKLKNDIILGIALLFAALCLWLILTVTGKAGGGLFAVVTVDNVEYGTYDLAQDREIVISGHNTVIIRDGSVWMEEADCPDKLCINQGRIRKAGQTIICLPNRVMVTIRGGKEEYDGIAR